MNVLLQRDLARTFYLQDRLRNLNTHYMYMKICALMFYKFFLMRANRIHNQLKCYMQKLYFMLRECETILLSSLSRVQKDLPV